MTRVQNVRTLSHSGPGKWSPRCFFLKEAFTLKIVHVHSWHLHNPKSECLNFAALMLSLSHPNPGSGVQEGKGCGPQVI